jgi:hypothetical protein
MQIQCIECGTLFRTREVLCEPFYSKPEHDRCSACRDLGHAPIPCPWCESALEGTDDVADLGWHYQCRGCDAHYTVQTIHEIESGRLAKRNQGAIL